MSKMSDNTLKGICEAKMNNALGWVGGVLSKQRQLALQYYRGDLFGNEQDGRSKVVSRDVAESIDGIMPSLIKVFAATDTVVQFMPRRRDAEEAAKQATDYINWVFQSQPNAFDLQQTWIKDGLLSKLGVVKSWWDESEEITTEEYEGLTKFQYLTLLSDPELEPIEVKTYRPGQQPIDPGADGNEGVSRETPPKAAQPPLSAGPGGQVNGAALSSIPSQGPPKAGPGELQQTPANFPGQAPTVAAQAPPGSQPPVPASPLLGGNPFDDGMLYDCKLKRTRKDGKIALEIIPPEEFLTDRRAISLDKATFCCHRSIRTATDLIEMGYSKEQVEGLSGGTELDYNSEVLNRFRQEDESPQREDTDALDPAMRHIWFAECYLKVDFDGDGVAEWRQVNMAGGGGFTILENVECDGHPFSAWTPVKEPHKLFGESMADKTMDLQLIKSTVWRQVLDGMYFNNAPQLVVMEGQANMEDVLTRRPGGIIRARSHGAVTPLPVQDSSQSGMAMLGYLDSVREARTGVRRWSPGLEGSELNPLASTATGVASVDDASDDTIELIARNFAEQGMKPLFKRLLKLICQNQDKSKTIRLRGEWVDIDPGTWDSEMDMQVMVGLGTGNKDKQVSQLMNMLTQIDAQIVQLQGGLSGPLLTADNVYNKLSKLVEASGYKTSDNLYTNPKNAPPSPPPKPDPQMAKVQGQLQIAQQKAQADLQAKAAQGQLDAKLEQEKMQRQASNEAAQAQAQMASDQHHAQLQAQLDQQRAAHQAQLDTIKMQHEIMIGRMRAAAEIEISRVKAAAEVGHKREILRLKQKPTSNGVAT